jgi:YHS domain-containing protein
MKKILLTIALALFALPAFAQGGGDATAVLTPVKPEYVCMVNNAAFDKPQIPVEVNGKTYYGCCPMCKERLAKDVSARTAIDPVSGKSVDKADAFIGKAPDGSVYYFENEGNMKQYKITPTPDAHSHEQ